MSKYTVNAGEKFDKLVERDLSRIVNTCLAVKYSNQIRAVILMGSYGRGEGTALQCDKILKPFNDYDLVLVFPVMSEWKRKRIQTDFHHLENKLSTELGIAVDLYIHTVNSLKRAESTLMNYEMKYGHMVVYGDEKVLSLMPDCRNVPLSEATRLLLNRGKLLLDISKRLKLKKSLTESEVLLYGKFLNKLILSMGDAALMSSGRRSIFYRDKMTQICEIKNFNDKAWLIEEYQSAIAFKFVGDTSLLHQNIKDKFDEIKLKYIDFYYEFESIRLQKNIRDFKNHFIEMDRSSCPYTFLKKLRNIYLNLRGFGMKGTQNYKWVIRHPRERLFTVFPLLLKNQLDLAECKLASRLQGCGQSLEICIKTFYQLREKYL